jgi:hypothetical protein
MRPGTGIATALHGGRIALQIRPQAADLETSPPYVKP